MKKIVVLASVLTMLAACGNKENDYDATGTFEATETTVSAEQSGVLLAFNVNEGDNVEAGREIGMVDTTQIWLKIRQLGATKDVYASQKPDMEKQIAATRQQLLKARQEQRRYQELVNDGAAPAKMLDDATSQVQVLQKQLDAQMSSLSISTRSLDRQMAATDVQVSQLRDQLRKCHVVVPTSGTVLEKYVERGEFVAMGKPLFKIADTDHLFLRAYVTSAQLQQVKLGQTKTILTDDERADLVYAVKIAVQNDGYAKIGMYGEVKFQD